MPTHLACLDQRPILTPTAPHYHPSEIILGHALAALRDEFPRESYSIITKCAKYGAMVDHHVYDPEVVKASVERSLRRLQTDYIDVMCGYSTGHT
jgi:aryl-alcohol dehydrogenase-like predicted oxidoreductase